MAHKITNANIKEWARDYQGELFDAILCDPPYELGFMGKSWDSSGIAFDQEMWADILKLLKPGGHLLAFSGSRTYHRMACAIEDAGFEIRDMIEWVYGSGFPKSQNISKVLDKKMVSVEAGSVPGQKQTNVTLNGTKAQPSTWDNNEYGGGNAKCPICDKWYISGSPCVCPKPEVTYKTDEAKYWQGYGTALKPAHEPCVLARKPLTGTVAANVLKHGTGGLNIDGTRVGAKTGDKFGGGGLNSPVNGFMGSTDNTYQKGSGFRDDTQLGRFPANLIHDGSDEVEAVFPQTSKSTQNKTTDNRNNQGSSMFIDGVRNPENSYSDSGSASRFFYAAKAGKSERNAGLEGFEEKSLKGFNASPREAHGEVRDVSLHTNPHPTVKPLSLTKYLATLIKPPTGGRLLVPFSGSGSEMIGGLQAGWEYVEGVELTEEYIPIAEARIKYWTNLKEEESNQLELI